MLVPLAEWARRELEERADEILDKDRRNYLTLPGLYYFDILSPDQLDRRNEREMVTKTGNFQVFRPGCYHRAWNPLINTRPSRQRQYSLIADPWRQFSWESVGTGGVMGAQYPTAWREEITSGWYFDSGLTRDPLGVTPVGQNYYYHLTIQQRCHIRSIMKAVPATKPLAREAVKTAICQHYGIPKQVISRVVVNNHSNDVQ